MGWSPYRIWPACASANLVDVVKNGLALRRGGSVRFDGEWALTVLSLPSSRSLSLRPHCSLTYSEAIQHTRRVCREEEFCREA